MIPDADLHKIGTDCSGDPRHLVTKHRGRRNKIVRGEEQVRMTEAGRLHIDENFTAHRQRCPHLRSRTRDPVR